MTTKPSNVDSLNTILHDFGVTYRALTKEERLQDIATAKAAIEQAVLQIIGEDEVDVTAGKYADRDAVVRDKLRAEQWKRAKAFIGSKHSGRES